MESTPKTDSPSPDHAQELCKLLAAHLGLTSEPEGWYQDAVRALAGSPHVDWEQEYREYVMKAINWALEEPSWAARIAGMRDVASHVRGIMDAFVHRPVQPEMEVCAAVASQDDPDDYITF